VDAASHQHRDEVQTWLRRGGLAYWQELLALPDGFVAQMERAIRQRQASTAPQRDTRV